MTLHHTTAIDSARTFRSTTVDRGSRADGAANAVRERVVETMARCGGNRTWAADILGLTATELRDTLLDCRRREEERARAIARREAALEDWAAAATWLPSVAYLA